MVEMSFRQRLEEHNNPEEVRKRLAAGNYNVAHARIAQEYLDSLGRKETAESAAKRDAREEETLRIAKKALSSAKDANRIAAADLAAARDSAASARAQARWAMWAAIIAAVAAIVATFKA